MPPPSPNVAAKEMDRMQMYDECALRIMGGVALRMQPLPQELCQRF